MSEDEKNNGFIKFREDGSIAMTPPYTPEEEVIIAAWRRTLRLKIARESYEQARDYYLEMKRLYLEHLREEVVIN